MRAFYETCYAHSPHPLLQIEKWQETVNLLASLYSSKCGVIVQYLDGQFKAIAVSNNPDNFLSKDDSWSDEIRSFCREIMETNKEVYVSDAASDPKWSCVEPVKDGPVRSYLGYPIFWPNGKLFGTICVIDTKATEYDQTFVALLGQFRDLISKDLNLIENFEQIFSLAINVASDGELHDILTLLARSVEAIAPDKGTKCSILLLEDEQYLRHGAGPSLPQFYTDAIDGVEIGPNVGSCGEAAYHKKTVITEDLWTHPNWAPFLDLVKEANLRACWSEPIISRSGEVLGTFAMYFDEPKLPTDSHIEMIKGCVLNARLAIEHSRMISALEEARETAEAANRAKTEFLGNMSHELRTPLNAIIGFGSVMEQETFGPLENEKYAQYVRDILQSGHFLLEMINDMLEISRIESNDIAPEPVPINLSSLIEDCFRVLQMRAAEKSISLTSEIDHAQLVVQADKRHLKQVVINLLTNAVKYTRAGDTVLVSANSVADQVELIVEDHGPGIPADQLESVFIPFRQISDRHTASTDGFGLGLPLSKALVEKNGGSLRLESVPEQGTKVHILLPAAENGDARTIA